MSSDPVLSIAKEVGSLVAHPAFETLKECWNYVDNYDNNVDEVQRVYRSLRDLKDETEQKVKLGDMNNQVVVPEVSNWIKEVDKFIGIEEEELKELLLDKEARKKAGECCFGFCWSPKYRYNVSKKAVVQTSNINKKIQVLRDRGQNPVTLDTKPPELISVSSPFFKGLNSREKLLQKILDLLRDDKVNRVGIHGMGGAGKTTLVQELARRCEGENKFDAILLADISEFPDFKRIQDQIAERIGFSFLSHYHDIDERAIHLSNRLMRIKNRQELYISNDQHVAIVGDQHKGIMAERIRLQKNLTSSKEKKLKNHGAQLEIIEEEGQILEDKRDEKDEKKGQQKGNSSHEGEKQGATEKSYKLLIILDNMWESLDLHLMGIPSKLEKDLGCKIIVTSRNEDACKAMGVSSTCIFKVGDLDNDEARQLFREKVGEIADMESFKEITTKLLRKCSHLPLSIYLVANRLKNQSLSVWERVLKELEDPIEEVNDELFGEIYSVIEISYKYLGNKEKQMFFLLCCIFPPGSSINIIDLLRYGIGLDLFQYVDSIVDALDKAYKWANDLKSSSLLIEVDARKGIISIHDDVRKAGKSFAEKDGFKFHVGAIPNMMKSCAYEKFTIISVTNDSYEHLDGHNMPKLQLLRFWSADSSKLSHSYFAGMTSLKVLDMSKSSFEEFPSSFEDLSKLEILLLEYCSLKILSQICKLVKLSILSFKGSNITMLPKEMGALVELKLLDLTDCNQLKEIPSGIFSCFKKLEALYMKQSISDWSTTFESWESLAELSFLPLKVLEINKQNIPPYTDGNFPVLGLIKNKISVVVSTLPQFEQDQIICSKDLQFEEVHARDLAKEGCKHLMNKAESLCLYHIKGLPNISPYLGEYWSDLKQLTVSKCGRLKYLINQKDEFQLEFFSSLNTLRLKGLKRLKAIYHGNSPDGLFSSLQELTLSDLSELQMCDIKIGNITRLRVLEVKSCEKLVSIFSTPTVAQSQGHLETNSSSEIQLTFLEKLILQNLPALKGLFAQTNARDSKKFLFSTVGDLFAQTNAGDTQQFLFTTQVTFPCLQKLKLKKLGQIGQLWDKLTSGQEFVTSFPKLKSISLKFLNSITYLWRIDAEHEASFNAGKLKKLKIKYCDSLEIVFPLSVATGLHKLKLLHIESCDKIKEVISCDGEISEQSNRTIIFSKLQTLKLWKLPELTYFYQGKVKIGFPGLKGLKLESLPLLKTLVRSKICSSNKEVIEAKENKSSNEPNGEEHYDLITAYPRTTEESLSVELILSNGDVEFTSLEDLLIKNVPNFEIDDDAISSFVFPRLQRLHLSNVNEIKVKPLLDATLNKINYLYIGGFMKLRYLVSSDNDTVSSRGALVKSLSEFEKLEELIIEDCDWLEGLFQVDEHTQDNNVTLLHSSLKMLKLSGLAKLKSLQWNMLPNLQSLVVDNCLVIAGEEKFLISATSVATGLQSLKSMTITSTPNIGYIIGSRLEEFQEENQTILFPHLKEIKLNEIRDLGLFYFTNLGNSTLCLPLLELVEFKDCGILRTFSSGRVQAPKLSKLEVNNKQLISNTCGDPNTALQREFELEYKITKQWPPGIQAKSHNHDILLSNAWMGELCGGCGKKIMKFSYNCIHCKFNLHPVCALEEFTNEYTRDWPKTLMHQSDEHKLKLVAGRDYSCNKCQQNGNMFSYTCEICEFDLHLVCAIDESQLKVIPNGMKVGKDLPKILRHESHVHELKLEVGRAYWCDKCDKWGLFFSYYCEICDFELHPECALEGSSVECIMDVLDGYIFPLNLKRQKRITGDTEAQVI